MEVGGGERNGVRHRKTQRHRDTDTTETEKGVERSRRPVAPKSRNRPRTRTPKLPTPRFPLPNPARWEFRWSRGGGSRGLSCHPGRPQAPRRGLPTSPASTALPWKTQGAPTARALAFGGARAAARGRSGGRAARPTKSPNSRRQRRRSGARAGDAARSSSGPKGEQAAKPGDKTPEVPQ